MSMTRDEYNMLDSNGRVECPDCKSKQTRPYPNCGCPSEMTVSGHSFNRHINLWHHECVTQLFPLEGID